MKEYNNFDLILGASKTHILNYFGVPNKAYNSILIYKKQVGTLVIIFDIQTINGQRIEEVAGFAIYNTEGDLLYVKGNQPLSAEQVELAEKMQTSEDIITTFGKPHFDLGSGIPNYGYISQKGEIILIGNMTGNSYFKRISI